ncbi:Pentatricopeptide repeat [Macleaya cordata]|uniref:Pentatricopeptide repeat n=1 Tax=Macleaya cordata TaxID=56857 RepID=A0A200QHX4_MACCD|nr:Pentatricopeptide repeat [Macleaya cordata]
MPLAGIEPNSYTFPFLLKSCTQFPGTQEGKQIHTNVLKKGLEPDPFVHTSLINMYARNGALAVARGCLDDARHLFDEIPMIDVVSWNAIIAAYIQSGRFKEALITMRRMVRKRVNF